MTKWPDKPLILIKKGRESRLEVRDTVAVATDIDCKGEDYYLLNGSRAGCTIVRSCSIDDIDAWEEVTAVPTAALKRLQDAFWGIYVIESLEPPLLEVLSYLSANKPSALDRAAALARELKGPRVTPDDTTSRRLAILLEAISFTHASPSKEVELTEIARTCADWLYIMNPNRVGLDDIETSAREIDRIPDDEEKRYMSLTYRFAQAATLIGEGDHGGQEIMELGAYALAWAAQIIEEEDK